ncbi:hypoxanthine phosphoribosyltransferase [Pedobacter lusitanus]|nr:hypoxanthine phosphoribosyltransferase [Pedobacter lusitanus]
MMNTIEVGDRKFEISITNERINERTKLIAAQISADYKDKCPIFIGVLNGSFLFMADLLKETEIPCEVAFMKVSSYQGGLTSSGEMKEIFGLPDNLKDRHLILVEDIVDTGFTLKYILEKVYLQAPASVRVCSLLFKPEAILSPIKELEYVGFEIPNEFVVGYGLDYDELGRNLKHIYRTIS